MSRSYRKHFKFATEGDRRNKKWSNRRIRRSVDVGNGSEYKKYFDSYDIKNFFIYYRDEEDFIRKNIGYGKSRKELSKMWRKYFHSK